MATKDELVEQATAAGIAGADKLNKDDLESALHGLEAAGRLVPEGAVPGDVQFKSSGKPQRGVQPQTESDIPEAGR